MQLRRRAIALLLTPALTGLAAAQGLYLGPDTRPHDPPPRHPVPHRPVPRHGPAIRLTSLQVEANITDGIATTELRQVFRNDGGRQGEGTWILPLPPGASADRFTMTVNGKEMPAEVLGAGKARSIYERIVRQQRDPGLLEYMGTGCLRARIFPIPAQGEIKVLVRFRQVLPETAGIHTWTYPLRASVAGGQTPERVSLDLKIRSRTALKSVYSPLAGVDITRKGDHEARVSLELSRGQLPERDITVFYGLSEQEFGLNLLTYRKHGEPGYFLMMLAPKQDWAEPENTAKVITFVLDTSGSMQGPKIEQARKALRFFLQSLKPGDLFNVVPFSTEARPFFEAPVKADKTNLDVALGKISEIEARGGTNIEDALRTALAGSALAAPAGMTYVPITVFLTDGRPTVGLTNVEQLLSQVKKQNTGKSRVFVFGVGNDVNSRLLDKIAADSRGDRDYVRENENIEVKTGALFTKLSHPVMTDVELRCAAIEGYDMFPRRTPDLFKGTRLLVTGRYKGDGHHAIRLIGNVNGTRREYVFEGTFVEKDTAHDFVPVLWAERKVGYLLDQIRLNGQSRELVAEVTRLGKEFGIVTPYTSHLILEEGMRVARTRGLQPQSGGRGLWFGDEEQDLDRVRRDLGRAGALPSAGVPATELGAAAGDVREEARRAQEKLAKLREAEEGKKAVDNSVALQGLTATAKPTARYYRKGGSAAQLIHRRVGDRSFYLAGGVWVDSRYTAAMKSKIRKIAAFSDDYFAILRQHPELARYLAFSSRIVVVVGDEVIEIT